MLTLSRKIAEHLAHGTPKHKTILIDLFAGVGGNTIAFARSGRWEHIYAVERDPQVMACAKHNAEVYGVADQITWFQEDCFDTIRKQEIKAMRDRTVVFASPPWGGESPYSHSKTL